MYFRHFTIKTDHQALKWLMSMKNPAPRLARWITRLEQYSFTIEYKKGVLHSKKLSHFQKNTTELERTAKTSLIRACVHRTG